MKQSRFTTVGWRRGGFTRGFTLVEVMISVALALILMYGVSQVFKLSGDAVGANQAVSEIVRDQRSAAPVFAEDFRNCAPDSPIFLISSRIAYQGPAAPQYFASGFRNADEQRNASNPDPTYVDGSPQSFIALAGTDRIPRMDRLGFFSRGLFRRQTVPEDPAKATIMSSGEAYIWYGHVVVPDLKGSVVTLQYPETQFAGDRILGRTATLLSDMSLADKKNNAPLVGQLSSGDPLFPFGWNSKPQGYYDLTKQDVMISDLAATTIDQFRVDANAYYNAAGFRKWFMPMEDDFAAGTIMRFWCTPIVTRPISPHVLSRSVPYFLGHCTHFIVEYAGDYLNQVDAATAKKDPTKYPRGDELVNLAQNITNGTDPSKIDVSQLIVDDKGQPDDGTIFHGTTDGQIDFVVDHSADTTPSDPGVRRIRWYGLPRDVNGDGHIGFDDVVPLTDVLDYAGIKVNGNPPQTPWERRWPTPSLASPRLKNPQLPKRKNEPLSQQDYSLLVNSDAPNFLYTCAWHNEAPAMIRILVKLDDPTGKLQDGQWYQFILTR